MRPLEANPEAMAASFSADSHRAESPARQSDHADGSRPRNRSKNIADTSSPTPLPRIPRAGNKQGQGYDLSAIEPFVKPEVVAWYLEIDVATVVRFAAAGLIPGHPLRDTGKRAHWRFLLSEIRENMLQQTGVQKNCASVRDQATHKR